MRKATPIDATAIRNLLESAKLPLQGVEDCAVILLEERDDDLIGCAGLEVHGSHGLLRSVAIHETTRGQGTGSKLVRSMINEAARLELSSVSLLTETARDYFPKFGFRVVERSSLPNSLQASPEFQGVCPDSATAMTLEFTKIRPAEPTDAARISEIYNQGIAGRMATFETQMRTEADVLEWFASSRYPFLVAELHGTVQGFIRASSYSTRECYAGIAEYGVYVVPEAQGRRIGDALMREFLPALEAAGFWKVLSKVFPENIASRALCARHGFREVGVYEQHAKLDGVWKDVVLVERLLIPQNEN
jgi:L-amino acid N-acyltransferase YncA